MMEMRKHARTVFITLAAPPLYRKVPTGVWKTFLFVNQFFLNLFSLKGAEDQQLHTLCSCPGCVLVVCHEGI